MNHVKDNILPGFPGISTKCDGQGADFRTGQPEIHFTYCGPETELLAAGIVTPEMIAVGRRKGGRKDRDGDRLHIDRYYRCAGGQPVRCLRLLFRKQPKFLASLPGAVAALEIKRAADAEWAQDELARQEWRRSSERAPSDHVLH